MKHPYYLSYKNQADRWFDALPLGNGRLGAMVYGHTSVERIQLNDDSLWYGDFIDRNNPSLKEKLTEIRELVLSGDIIMLRNLLCSTWQVPVMHATLHLTRELDIALNQHLPFADGWLPHSTDATEYFSKLDLMEGVLYIDHSQDGVAYHREMFVSHPDQVMCIRYTSDEPGKMNLDIKMNRVEISDAVAWMIVDLEGK